ncbi:MAG: ATP-dependent Clp protease ATP-binding subunit [Mycoplasma sp.]
MELKQKSGPGAEPALEQFGRNLNKDVMDGKVDPIIGRESEIRRIIEVISRKTKNNPILIGEPGVGKTAIVEGLAQRIVAKDVPDNLQDKVIWELSLSSLISGASFQGQFEQRLHDVIKQVKGSDGKIILFIDEIHQIVGAGKSSGGSAMDAANILKPMMARGEVKIIGATTLEEYRQYIEKDSALERRMSKIIVDEPSKQESLTIMRGLKEKWELYHQVKIHDDALVAAVDLSDRYIPERFLPDKAIDLIDEAAAKVQTEMHSIPTQLDTIRRQIMHIETEKAALEKESDIRSQKRLAEVNIKLEDAKAEEVKLNANWIEEKKELNKVIKLKEEIDSSRQQIEKFQIQGEFAKASKLLYVTIPALQKELERVEGQIKKNGLVTDAVTAHEIGEVISKSTGIPINKILKDEKEKLLSLPQQLQQTVSGQDETLKKISNAILRSRAGINDPNRPIGSFLFLGPTGVGKTEVAKALARLLFDSEKSMVRLDMSEYMEKHSVSKMVGAPPGYVGYEQAGALTEAVRRKPYCVVLLDEIEKAHPDVLNILLQVLDDGQIKDSQGRQVNFKNTIIIMTSNIGAMHILDNKKAEALEDLKREMKPEFINRIDDIIIFNPLKEQDVLKIISKFLNQLSERLADQDIKIQFSDELKKQILKAGFDPQFGARPLKRYIQNHIENKLATLIVSNTLKKNHSYKINYDPEKKEIVIVKSNNLTTALD